ncbi:hypothetical protein AAF712_004887 [Marasmius tenuissimus]|uniref:Bromo domain-containing protein n=1 Tax=Marasmius tenuissimus TaxID=585030 RepID=A0ABR3A3Q0_9AGAR
MPITTEQKAAIENVINTITSVTAPGRGKRNVSSMFMALVDRNEWPEYFEIIPEPRSLNNIKASLEKNRYKDPLDVYTDLALVFWNAVFYNEESSQIARDAENLKKVLETEWNKQTILPQPRSTSPPPQSAQKVHKVVEQPPLPPVAPKAVAPSQPVPPTPVPIATVSTAPTQPKPPVITAPAVVPVASSSRTVRQPSPDIEIDIGGMSPEPEGQLDDLGAKLIMQGVMQRDAVSEEIVNQLERSLPRWPGFSEQGWMEEGNQNVYSTIVHAVKSYKDVIGNRLASAIEEVPEVTNGPTSTLTTPLSLKIIENRVRQNEYTSPQDFDKDMARLFEKARRWHEPCTEPYGNVLLLQRLYQALTSADPPPGPPYSSTTNFASLKAGPGNVKPVHGDGEGAAGVTSHRVLTRDKTFVDEVHYKGWSVKLADWLHLSNPDDPSRPIIAQVFRCWTSEEENKKGQLGVTVSWYYRPEQNWNSCIPEEVRKSDEFMPIYPFERAVYPSRLASPFLSPGKGSKGPGGLLELPADPGEAEIGDSSGKRSRRPLGDTGHSKALNLSAQPVAPATAQHYVQPVFNQTAQYNQPPKPPPTNSKPAIDRTVLTAAGGSALGNNVSVKKLPPETTRHFDRDPQTNEVLWFASPPVNMAPAPTPKHSLAYLHFLAKKRKQEAETGEDEDSPTGTAKKSRFVAPPTVLESLAAVVRQEKPAS